MTNTTRNTSAISRSGKRGTRKTATSAGKVRGAAAVPVGTSNAVPWRPRYSAIRSIFTAAASITFSPITKRRLRETAAGKLGKGEIDMQPGQEFEEALDDDLNISAALGFLFESIRKTNRAIDRNEVDASSANAWLTWWQRANSVLAIEEEAGP